MSKSYSLAALLFILFLSQYLLQKKEIPSKNAGVKLHDAALTRADIECRYCCFIPAILLLRSIIQMTICKHNSNTSMTLGWQLRKSESGSEVLE